MATNSGRVPPYSIEAERSVLGAILLNNRAVSLVRAERLTPDSFYVESNRRIFQAMVDLHMKGEPIDHVTLGNFLSKKGDLEKIGGAMFLSDLTDSVATVLNVGHYAKIVIDKAARRQMIYAAQKIVAEGYNDDSETLEYLSGARKEITLAAGSIVSATSGPRQVDEDLVEIYDELQNQKDPEGLVKTGIASIDNVTGGLWPGLMTIVAGRPGMGKSALILNIANNVSLSGKKVLYVTLEDARKFVVYRMIARFANIDLTDLMLRRVRTSEEFTRIVDAMSKLGGKKPLWLEDAAGLTSEQVAQICAQHKEIHGLDLVIIDHLGESADKGESKTAITTDAARNYRDIAKSLNIPVLLVSQLNRSVEQRPDKHPLLSDLRQSGEIEAVARVVWFLYREGYYLGEEGMDRHDLELIVAKANHGRLGMIKHYADLAKMFIRSWDVETDGLWPNDENKFDTSPSKKASKDEFSGNKDKHWTETDGDY